MNLLWLLLMLSAVLLGIINHRLNEVVQSVLSSAQLAVQLMIGLGGVLCFWLGIMKIAEQSGITATVSKGLNPLLRRLFPDVPADHPAMQAIAMNITANMMGLSNAATPLGLQAMQELQALNTQKNTASNAMCMFLAINTSSVQLIPTTAIAYLAASGAKNPTHIILPALLATLCSTLIGIGVARCLQSLPLYRVRS